MALEKTQKGSLPDLPYTGPKLDIDADDVSLPRVRVAHPSSTYAQDNDIKAGTVYVSEGEGSEPVTLTGPGKDAEGVVVHVLALSKYHSLFADGQGDRWDWDDESRPSEAWRTWDYTLFVPEFDTEMPVKWAMSKTSAAAAKQINTALKKAETRGPAYTVAFRIKTLARQNDKGRWHVPQVTVVEAERANIEAAGRLAELVAVRPQVNEVTSTATDEPEI